MADKERITSPSMGSNELGRTTSEEIHTGVSAGTDTQMHIAALGAKKHKKDKNVNDDERVVKNAEGNSKFLESDETDE